MRNPPSFRLCVGILSKAIPVRGLDATSTHSSTREPARSPSHLSQSTLFFRPYLRRRPTKCVWVDRSTDSGTKGPVCGSIHSALYGRRNCQLHPQDPHVRRGRAGVGSAPPSKADPHTTPICTGSSARSMSAVRHRMDFPHIHQKMGGTV